MQKLWFTFYFKFGKKTTTTKKDKQRIATTTTTIHLTEPCIKWQTHSSGGSRVRARPPLPRPLSEVLDTPLHSPYLHLEALKVQNSLSDNYQLPPSPPPKKVTSGNETEVDPSSFIMLFFKLTSFLLSSFSCEKERVLYQNKVNLSLT